ncbi:hypothetical protein [Candidatus Poriferisodalis sp.]
MAERQDRATAEAAAQPPGGVLGGVSGLAVQLFMAQLVAGLPPPP